MAKIRRCIIKHGNTPQLLEYQPSLSISILGNNMIVYTCNGDDKHPFHFVRIQYDKANRIATSEGVSIFSDSRRRLTDRTEQHFCPIGKCSMKLLKRLTNAVNDECIDIFECKGRLGAHPFHLVRIVHGVIVGTNIPIIQINMEKKEALLDE